MTEKQFYILLVLLIVLLIVALIIILFQIKTSKFIVGKKFKLKNYNQTNNEAINEKVLLTIHNTNFIDSRILGFGYLFKDHSIDYMSEYMKNNELSEKVIISSRDFITTSINKEQLFENIRYFNNGNKKVKSLKLYVIDHQGELTKTNASIIKKDINTKFKAERILEKKAKEEIKKQEKIDKATLKRDLNKIKKSKNKAIKNLEK